jgi:predicted alpha/beta superfamily hydrolase
MTNAARSRIEVFSVTSAVTGRTFSISLAHPFASMTGETPQDCPILFVLDSGMTFGTAVDAAGFRAMIGQLTPAVIVGVGYEGPPATFMHERTKDLSPPASAGVAPELAGMIGSEHGGADGFLEFLVTELAEAVRARAPEASATRRILFGHSLGGLFAVHALMTRPDSFETFVASSPSLWWDDFSVLKRREELDAKLKATGASPRVLVTIASAEQDVPKVAPPGMDLETVKAIVAKSRMVDAAREFAESLQSAALSEAGYVCFADEDHGSVVPAAIGRGITFALTPR